MPRQLFITLLLCVIITSSAYAGVGSSFHTGQYNQTGSVVAVIQLDNEQIYNLVVSIQFLGNPQEGKIYKSENYNNLIRQLSVEWKGLAVQIILNNSAIKLGELVTLKTTIERELKSLIETRKKQFFPDKEVGVVFSVSHFYLTETKE